MTRENGIAVERTCKFRATTDSNRTFSIAPNLPDRDFTAGQPNQKRVGDISCIWTCGGWQYLVVILDLYSSCVIALRDLHPNPFRVTAWAVSNRMKSDLAIRGLRMAIALRAPPKGCNVPSDRGSQ